VAGLLRVMAVDQAPERPDWCEPQALKCRPKPDPLLNKPRHRFKETAHRNRYWKNNSPKRRS
jgi:hypothetical protein